MIQVIKTGDPKTKRFKCSNCNCEFIADIVDYSKSALLVPNLGLKSIFICDCPYCGEVANELIERVVASSGIDFLDEGEKRDET